MKDDYSSYSDHILTLTSAIERLRINQGKAFDVFRQQAEFIGRF